MGRVREETSVAEDGERQGKWKRMRVPGLAQTRHQTSAVFLCPLNFALKLSSGGSRE